MVIPKVIMNTSLSPHEFSMYLHGKWYALEAKTGTYNDNDPIGCLDVTLLQNMCSIMFGN